MKQLLIFTLVITLLVSCKKETVTPKPTATKETPFTKDQKEIEKLVKDMYHWVGNAPDDPHGWRRFIKDSLVVGYDQIGHSLYMMNFNKNGYFSTGFIDNMARIFNTQDKLLRNGKVKWHVNDMSPFHGDANPWCNCQDGGLNDITLHFEKTEANTATFYWYREDYENSGYDKLHYHMRAIKEGGKWKIDYMEGWDYEANTTVL